MTKKTDVAVICGGVSAEHEVSLVSAKNILGAIDRSRFNPLLIGISKKGEWFLCPDYKFLPDKPDDYKTPVEKAGEKLAIVFGNGPYKLKTARSGRKVNADVFFPIVHGPNGEDGTLQGLLTLLNTPFVGPDTTGSALGMDKDVMKRLCLHAGIKTARFFSFSAHEKEKIDFETIKKRLGVPLFVKPARLGSSVGINKVSTRKELDSAVKEAFRYDKKIIIEEAVKGREVECAVLGNENPKASIAGEIIPKHSFYSYEAKYVDQNGAELVIPAKLKPGILKKIRETALKSVKILECEGLARVDMFLTPKNEIYFNEVNTLPGFTSISMYPKLWEKSGITYKNLITELIKLAVKRHTRDSVYQKNNSGK